VLKKEESRAPFIRGIECQSTRAKRHLTTKGQIVGRADGVLSQKVIVDENIRTATANFTAQNGTSAAQVSSKGDKEERAAEPALASGESRDGSFVSGHYDLL